MDSPNSMLSRRVYSRMVFLCVIFLVTGVTANAQVPAINHDAQKVIETFWTALGVLDADTLGQTLDWPMTIVETSAKQTKNPRVLTGWDDLKKDFNQSKPASGKSEFYGTKLGEFKFQPVNESLLLVTYVCTLPNVPYQADSKFFSAMTVLRKDENSAQPWKIIFITVPR